MQMHDRTSMQMHDRIFEIAMQLKISNCDATENLFKNQQKSVWSIFYMNRIQNLLTLLFNARQLHKSSYAIVLFLFNVNL